MTEPWLKDACSLVDAFRAKTLSPTEALEASLAAIEASDLNAFSLVDAEAARAQAAAADLSLPFGGVPIGVKELEPVDGWPYTEASLVFADRMSEGDSTHVTRLRAAGAVLAGQTTASEFGGVNCTATKLHGITRNPWDTERTPGGSSGGSAAAEPPEDPPGVRSVSHGLRVMPCSLVAVQLTPPNSEAVVWPARTAPAARSRVTWVESPSDIRSANTSDASV